MPAKAGYSYYKEVPINHTDDAAQNLYQMKVLVGESSGSGTNDVHCEGHCLSTFNDLFFQGYDADGSTIIDLDYWIESISGTTPNQVAIVWVEVHYIPAHPDNTTVWMSYGKAGASPVSNGANTFVFFEHWDGTTSNWSEDTTYAAIASSIMTYTPPAGFKGMIGNVSAPASCRWRAYQKIATGGVGTAYVGVRVTGGYDSPSAVFTNDVYVQLRNKGAGLSYIGSNWLCNAYYTFEIRVVANSHVHYFQNEVECSNSPLATNAPNITMMKSFVGGYVAATSTWQDWCFIAAYTDNEPTWGAWGSEETGGTTAPINSTSRAARFLLLGF